MHAQLIEGFVVIHDADMGQLMHANHAQKRIRRLLEHGRNMNLMPGIGLAAMRNRTPRVQAQSIAHHMNLAVISHLVQLACITQIFRLNVVNVVIKRLICAHHMGLRILFQQPLPGLSCHQPFAYLALQRQRITRQIWQGQLHRCILRRGARSPVLAQLLCDRA